jgi:hypothetical protein
MQAYGRSTFADQFAETAADSDYSRHPQLQGVSQYDIRAAAEAVWTYATREGIRIGSLERGEVVRAMLAQVKRWDDEGELVSVEFEEYWDATDAQNLPSSLLDEMKKALARNFLEGKKGEHIVVDNRDGIWLFDKSSLRAALVDG